MKRTGNTVLITGGTSGIGLALVERFLKNGNRVITCARGEARLAALKNRFPEVHTVCGDIGVEEERKRILNHVFRFFPETNILINNAGIQQRMEIGATGDADIAREIAINLTAPLSLSNAVVPHLRGKDDAYIVNVSSGLAFLPPVWTPVYGATKAGLHAFTFGLRAQLAGTGIGVVEIIPPAVDTNLGGAGVHTGALDVDVFADRVWKGFEMGEEEIGFGASLVSRGKTRAEMEQLAKERMGK